VADINTGLGGVKGISAAKMKLIGEKSLQPYIFLALYLKPYYIPILVSTTAESTRVSELNPFTSWKSPAPSST